MANRSYLYSIHPDEEPNVRDLGEWKSMPPVSHYLLVGANCESIRSEIWGVEEKIALRGTAPEARKLFLRFLEWLEPQFGSDAEFVRLSKQASDLLQRDDRQGTHYHLELGETYELAGYTLEEMAKEIERDAETARAIYAEVSTLVETPGGTIEDAKHWQLVDVAKSWEENLGLYFLGVLYFHMG